jgi:type IV pilus assembly protein PilQ
MIVAATFFFSTLNAVAQDYPRETTPDERITLDSSIPIKTALSILSQYSLKYENKIIIDTANRGGAIDVMVNNMYWKRALEFILRSNLLKYEERENYYEVVPMVESTRQDGEIVLNTGTREVEINATFFEADYQAMREAGINWDLVKTGKVTIDANFADLVSAANIFSVGSGRIYQSGSINGLLRTLEQLSTGEVIASPQIKVMDGQEGRIQVGINFFLQTQDFAGNARNQQFETGVILTVVPQVIGAGDSMFVHLDIQAERSSIGPNIGGQPSISKSQSSTEVILTNGEETFLGGMFSEDNRGARVGIPFLKDLPPWFFGLRYLFGYESKQVIKKELVIVLQVKVVPTVAERVAQRLNRRTNPVQQQRMEFLRKQQQLRSKNGYAPQSAPRRRK